jgi:hypothetical protein
VSKAALLVVLGELRWERVREDSEGLEECAKGPVSTPQLQLLLLAKIRKSLRIPLGVYFGPLYQVAHN